MRKELAKYRYFLVKSELHIIWCYSQAIHRELKKCQLDRNYYITYLCNSFNIFIIILQYVYGCFASTCLCITWCSVRKCQKKVSDPVEQAGHIWVATWVSEIQSVFWKSITFSHCPPGPISMLSYMEGVQAGVFFFAWAFALWESVFPHNLTSDSLWIPGWPKTQSCSVLAFQAKNKKITYSIKNDYFCPNFLHKTHDNNSVQSAVYGNNYDKI